MKQKSGKHVYIYEAESYWDPEKKSARQRRRYIGKLDPQTGEIVTPRKSVNPRRARRFGAHYLIRQLSASLMEKLKRTFHKQAADIFNLAAYQLCEAQPFNRFKYWLESTYIDDFSCVTSQDISRLLKSLGRDDRDCKQFIHDWVYASPASRAVVFDITSLSSFGRLLDMLEWGYNRDRDRLPQINLGMTLRIPDGIPLSYHIYPGSIGDVSTLKGIVKELKSHKISISRFVLDRGFYSKTNIREMADNAIPFLIPLPFSTKLSSALISETKSVLENVKNAFVFKKHTLFHTVREVHIDGVLCRAHVFLDPDRRNRELNTLMQRMNDLERWIDPQSFKRVSDAKTAIQEEARGLLRYYRVKMDDGNVQLIRKDRTVSYQKNRMGKTIILSKSVRLPREEIVDLYRRKDMVEKLFDTLKNELNCDRLRIQNHESLEGRLFIAFITLIMYFNLHSRLHESKLSEKYSTHELLKKLDTICAVEMANGQTRLTEISKKQRDIFNALHASIPVL
ncbi:IS1634 family transposase [bacterium]|nr:IS1634 family transposase [candidate division CSSED10-310 bacterium]